MICGYKGMVGSTIVNQLKNEGYKNLFLYGSEEIDFRKQTQVEQMFKKIRPEYVFLAAAKVGGIVANNTYKAEFIYDNLAIGLNIIHSAHNVGVKKLLNLGSSCIYPKFSKQPMKEEYLLSGKLEPTNEPYAIAKIAAIQLCKYYNEQYNDNFISIMPSNLYGIKDNYNFETSHVLPAMIRKILLSKFLKEERFDLLEKDIKKRGLGFGYDEKINWNLRSSIKDVLYKLGIFEDKVWFLGTGEVEREFLHVKDLSKACVYFMNNFDFNDIGEFVNVGYGKDISIKDLTILIKNIINHEVKIVFDKRKHLNGTPKKLLDISKALSFGWKSEITLENGIKELVKDYLNEIN